MIKSKEEYRKRIVSSTIASVKAEGLHPSNKALTTLRLFANGKISPDELKKRTLHDVHVFASRNR